ncbi:class I SAM-dependent methyltransferase [Rhodoblastus sp.]|uniref:class I SAM-dependent methyltransferase n=1 Tax=Rhodoblastus sp. TaxID=1962975 RepID=UPI00262FA609|nr:class I SAM-dependent methyltransferase [Rhodoblastus sp.]
MEEKKQGTTEARRTRIGIEFRKAYDRRLKDGFIERFLSGKHILDVGYRGGDPNSMPITDEAIGVELGYPGYDGVTLPFPDGSQDAVMASHVLEHISLYQAVLADWYRVLRVGGYLVIFVPHRFLFERRPDLPSKWNGDHRRFYTATSLLAELDESLPLNGWRIRHLVDNDAGYDYKIPLHLPPQGSYEIELVVEKIEIPEYTARMVLSPLEKGNRETFDAFIFETIAQQYVDAAFSSVKPFSASGYFTPWNQLRERFVIRGAPEIGGLKLTDERLKSLVRPLLDAVDVDVESYSKTYHELQKAVADGRLSDLALHWRNHGYFEGRTWD